MIAPDNIQQVYFIGIGGIGMSALARYFHERGALVSGYDRAETALTRRLTGEGMQISYADDAAGALPGADLVVYTPAIPESNPLLRWYREQGYPLAKRSEVLQAVTRDMRSIAVAGTHGKTTVSTCIAHILRDSGHGCHAFLGGISVNYDTNYWSAANDLAVVEADEYDRSFLRLSPDLAVLTAMDADHLDIYGDEASLREAYAAFTGRIRQGGTLLHKFGLAHASLLQGDRRLTYSLQNSAADCYGRNITQRQGSYRLDIVLPGMVLQDVTLQVGGMHNVENAVAAAAVAGLLKLDPQKIIAALASFRGVRRRFEYIVRNDRHVFIDDYAHHPEELKSLLNGAMTLFPGRPCTIIFQPHLYSRTRDLAEDFARVLDAADEVILLPVYPAREAPVPGVDSAMIAERMTRAAVQVLDRAAALERIRELQPALLITAGAGDIDKLVQPLRCIIAPADMGDKTETS